MADVVSGKEKPGFLIFAGLCKVRLVEENKERKCQSCAYGERDDPFYF
ncbi:hypothetical protein [Bacillus licheniformis]|nr:hypothetical protein [Bacillus licheniformis]